MSQHHGPWLSFRFWKYNASPMHAVVRLDAFLFLGSFPHTHPGLWLISLCSCVFWSTEVFGRRSAEWLFISSCFHDIISLCVWSSGLASLLKPGPEITKGSTEIFNSETQRWRCRSTSGQILNSFCQIQFPSSPPAPEQQYWSAGYLSDPKPDSASRIMFPHFPDSIREVEPSMFNILHVLKWFD